MIYTVTFNPAVDYVVHLEEFQPGRTNRSVSEEVYWGGKGINVSIVLKNLGVESVPLGFIAGFTGTAIEEGLQKQGIRTDFIRLECGISRINLKIKTTRETEINAQGPEISEAAAKALDEKLDALQSGDTLVLAGSIPSTLPSEMYEKILKRLSGRGIRFLVDATGDLLVNVLKYQPFLIKPNRHELEEICARPLPSIAEVAEGARELQRQGAQNVLVSLGKDGALLLTEQEEILTAKAVGDKPVNTVGAGDSMVAGFLAGYLETGSYEYALKLGSAAGGATACSKGLAQREEILQLLK
jgi:1-phosphofructokinase